MQFLRTIRKSIYDVDFYVTAKANSSAAALKYYTLFVLCAAFIIAIPIYVSFGIISSQIKEAGDIRTRVLALYPDELVLNFQNGHMTSNVEEPYAIPVPPEFSAKTPKNLIVINTSGSIVPADFDRYDTLAILGGDAIWTRDTQKDKIEIQRFDQFSKGSMVINKQKATEGVDIALRVGKIFLTIFLVFLPLIIFVALWISYLLYLLFGACVIWLVAKLRKTDLTYGQSYKIGLYLLTLPILYSVLTMGPLAMLKIPFAFTLILAAIAYANLAPKKTTEVVSPPVPETENATVVPKVAEVEPVAEVNVAGDKSVDEEKK